MYLRLLRLYTNGLSNSFRTETFTFTEPGQIQSFFIQGSQRWQTVSLVTNTSVTISGVGFQPSVNILPANCLAGSFTASNSNYNDVWNLGARAVQASCFPAKSQPSTWEAFDNGSLIRGQYPGFSADGLAYSDYTMTFSTNIIRGGPGWRVAASANSGYGAYFVLTSATNPLLNTSETGILPANTLIAGYGFSIVNEAILSSAPPQYYKMPFTILENEWYSIETILMSTGYNISINGTPVASISNTNFLPYVNTAWGNALTTEGTWGFGPFLDQAAYFADVKVVSNTGDMLYSNSFTTTEVNFEEYGIATNGYDFCVDGAKRDREVWIGDFVHTARELAASTGGYNFIQSMIEFELSWQLTTGPGADLVPIQQSMGDGFAFREVYYPLQYSETDYQFFFLLTIGDYYALTSDSSLLSPYWNNIQSLVDTLITRYLDPYSGLMANNDASWFTAQGTQNATAPSALFVIAMNQLVHVANALDDATTAAKYASIASDLSLAINNLLWSPTLGAYEMSLELPTDIALLATAYTIRGGIANTTQATSSIESLSQLFYEVGYKDSSVIINNPTTQLSPNVQGFLLESLFLAVTKLNVTASVVVPVISNLLDVYWPLMSNQNAYSTGGPWEYMYPDGSPGIGIFTSLCHPWGGAPTYVLTDYVLGVRPEFNETTGTYGWVFDPVWGVVEGLNVTSVKGTVPLLGGGYIEASWAVTGDAEPVMSAQVVGAGAGVDPDVTIKYPGA